MSINPRFQAKANGLAANDKMSPPMAGAPIGLQPSTVQDLYDAMKGEAYAASKYLLFAAKAAADGHSDLAELFENTAAVESREHFAEHAKLAGLVGMDATNLADAIAGESYETDHMYREMAARAEAVGDTVVAEHFLEVAADEAKHRDAYVAALAKLSGR